MGFWAALGGLFTLLFAPPIISFESLRNTKRMEHFTVKNVTFGMFWGVVITIATSYGVWVRLWEAWLVDYHTFCDSATWFSGSKGWIGGLVIVFVASGWTVNYLYTNRPDQYKPIHQIIDGTIYYLKSAYNSKMVAQLLDIMPVFMKQLSMNYFLFRTRDDDGEIMVIDSVEEKPEIKKAKSKFGVPRSIRRKQKQAIESAQTVVKHSNGSIGKASGPMKKK